VAFDHPAVLSGHGRNAWSTISPINAVSGLTFAKWPSANPTTFNLAATRAGVAGFVHA
jgi:hypothetical protein